MDNEYLKQVQQSTVIQEEDLKMGKSKLSPPSRSTATMRSSTTAIDVKVSGFWKWRSVVVPPNALVVHTRRGQKEPLHCGLGLSFKFNPYTDAYLAVPAAMQTLIINANCICKERQGVMVQAYLQWVIDDFSLAYQKLDFSDPYDPMRVTNAQLRQQAEATVKDTVAGMGIDKVLADKQPIMEELTRRLREVAEGREGQGGLGLRIVTVQIKEAIVSSASLWESLQQAFRSEREEIARIAKLESASRIRDREHEDTLKDQSLTQMRKREAERMKMELNAQNFDLEQTEKARRAELEAKNALALAEQEEVILKAQSALEALKGRFEREERQELWTHELLEMRARLEVEAERLEIAQKITPNQLREQLISLLPEIAKALPQPKEMRVYEGGQSVQLTQLLDGLLSKIEDLG